MNKNIIEKLIWSIALPGFGQFLNKKYFKGIVLLILEFIINIQANFNQIIIMSFHGEIGEAIKHADYQWLMFYPCLYFFSIWDSVKDAGGGKNPISSLPYAFAAFFVTVGLIFSSELMIFGVLFGPVWLPMLFVIPGVAVGLISKKIINRII
ncbi:TM2 domain-containing membrane protein YozV [Cytobacillus eiseniae]|uniref:TM2 domain-containing membrane protein YozV n=1 Tax=Cytobacillus eiseniae TaxID=762947 RepID=A0ABS4RJB1_9BACI|nr:hypothetical protein [Cytobacillus eiseniae]MBP2242973.1 TM2 domain-containing membrane protein YozV [Cytobacillus eiseniae]